ncbi:lysylphosphatidylglycerol synthase domain-containing protein, partial [Candidatus Cloacimonadota bacterium]
LPSFIFFWAFSTSAFYFFIKALTLVPIPIAAGFTFPLAATLGIIALIAPGGLGAREGVLTVLLNSVGIDIVTATSISVASRIWYLTGELFIFVAGFIIDRLQEKSSTRLD